MEALFGVRSSAVRQSCELIAGTRPPVLEIVEFLWGQRGMPPSKSGGAIGVPNWVGRPTARRGAEPGVHARSRAVAIPDQE